MKELKVYGKSIPFGIMIWWDKCEDAAMYQVHLYLENKSCPNGCQELTTVTVERNTFYHTFTGLADQRYLIAVSAENREGKEIESGMMSVKVESRFEVYGYTGG